MARGAPPLTFRPIRVTFAIDLYEALIVARRLQLQPALSLAVRQVGVAAIDADLLRLVPVSGLNQLAGLGLRGERVFPVPAIIRHAPPLIGYYRMLLGLSRKEFSQPARLGYGSWAAAEESGILTPRLDAALDQFCAALIDPLMQFVAAMKTFDDRDLGDITLLTLGSTFQGGRNNVIGRQRAEQLFQAIRAHVTSWISYENERLIRFTIPGGREYECVAASDPDVRIDARAGGELLLPLVAIEIKGGGDASNAHNRAGEAEKSHLKAAQAGYEHRWTVIGMRDVRRKVIASETPSSTRLFEADEVLKQTGPDWDLFRQELRGLLT